MCIFIILFNGVIRFILTAKKDLRIPLFSHRRDISLWLKFFLNKNLIMNIDNLDQTKQKNI